MPVDVVLDRVLDRDDLHLGVVGLREHRVERRGLARAGGPVTSTIPCGSCVSARRLEPLPRARGRAREVEADGAAVEHAQHAALARLAGSVATRRSTGAAVDRELDAAVLRHARLGDVEVGHDLDARDQRRARGARAAPRSRTARRRRGSGSGTRPRRARGARRSRGRGSPGSRIEFRSRTTGALCAAWIDVAALSPSAPPRRSRRASEVSSP